MNGMRLKNLRELRGLTQGELAKHCNIAPKQIWRYENNESEPGAGHLKKLAYTLQVSSDYLLGLVDNYTDRYVDHELTDFQQELLSWSRDNNLASAIRLLNIVTNHATDIADQLPVKCQYGED